MTSNPIFRGVATALITPLNESGIDFSAFARLIDWQIAAGVAALVIAGTTGEGSTLTDEEHRAARGKGQRQQTDPADQVASLFVQSHCLLRTPLLSRTACGTDRGSGPSPCGRSG